MNKIKMGQEFHKYATKHRGINSLVMHDYSNAAGLRSEYKGAFAPTGMTPNVIEERHMNAVSLSVFDRLMMDRIIFLGMPIDETVANVVLAQLLFMESADSKKDIQLYLNTPGGSVVSGMAIHDTMGYIGPDVSTLVTGMSASMGFILAISGAKGKRFALPHSRLMAHQPMSQAGGQASDIEITHKEIQKHKKELYQVIVDCTGKTYKEVESDCDRDYWLRADEALKYGPKGAIDKVVGKKKK